LDFLTNRVWQWLPIVQFQNCFQKKILYRLLLEKNNPRSCGIIKLKPPKTGRELVELFRDLKSEVALLRKSFEKLSVHSVYGSEKWWEKMDNKALTDIKNGYGIVLENNKDIDKFFESL